MIFKLFIFTNLLTFSQTPHGQTPNMDLRKNPHLISAGGGFGPVSYGEFLMSAIS